MNIIASTDFSLLWKVFLYPTIIGFVFLGLWDGVDSWQTNAKGQLYLIDIPFFSACVAGLIYLIRHKLLLTESELWQYGFSTKCLKLDAIESITEYLGSYSISSGKVSIRITTDLQDKDLFRETIIYRIKQIDLEQNVLPGRRLNSVEQARLFEQVHYMIAQGRQNNTMYEADNLIFNDLSDANYYLVYEHPIHDFLYRAYYADLTSLKIFLAKYITSQKSDLNIGILPLSLKWLIGCNREGKFFLRKDWHM